MVFVHVCLVWPVWSAWLVHSHVSPSSTLSLACACARAVLCFTVFLLSCRLQARRDSGIPTMRVGVLCEHKGSIQASWCIVVL